jgi:hypothetical protein
MLRAIDNVLALSMFLKGTNPQAMAAERELDELHAREAGKRRAEEWSETAKLNLDHRYIVTALTKMFGSP